MLLFSSYTGSRSLRKIPPSLNLQMPSPVSNENRAYINTKLMCLWVPVNNLSIIIDLFCVVSILD